MSSNTSAIAQPDFTDARLKLARADKHIAEVETLVRGFLSTDFYQMRVEPSKEEGRMRVVFDSSHQSDKAINATIGDAIGNIRSTLDYILVALVYQITCQAKNIGFPFADDVGGFSARVGGIGCLGRCSPVIQKWFVDHVQAYQDGRGHTLWIVNRLRNIDKHRLLLTTAQLAGVKMPFRDQNGNTFIDFGIAVTAGQSGTFIDAPAGHIEITDQPRATFEIRFEEQNAARTPVIEFLHSARRETEDLLNRLQVFIDSRRGAT